MINKVQFVVLSCDKYLSTRVESIKQTWGQYANCIYIIDSESNTNNIIGYNTPKNYTGIQDKYRIFFQKYNFLQYDYYFFVDDDTFVNLNNFFKINFPDKNESVCIFRELRLNPDGTDMWGGNTGYPLHTITGHNTTLPITHPSGGAGFLLTQKACLQIQQYLNTPGIDIPRTSHGDVTIGFWMRNCAVKLIPSNNLWWETPVNLKLNKHAKFSDELNFITYHYVNEKLMVEYNNIYNK